MSTPSPSVNLTTSLTSSPTPSCLPTPATSILFQLSHFILLLGYLSPSGHLYSTILTHAILAIGHLLLSIWLYGVSCYRAQFPTLLGWSVAYLLVNIGRALYQVYLQTMRGRLSPELSTVYETLFEPIAVPRDAVKKFLGCGKMMTLQLGESYAMEGVTATDRLGLLVSGKINVMSAGQFLHHIYPYEFLDSPEWESSSPTSTITCNGATPKGRLFSRGKTKPSVSAAKSFKGSLANIGAAVNSATRYEIFDGTTGKTGNQRKRVEIQQRFNITLVAMAPSRILCWQRPSLEYYLAKNSYMAMVLNLLLARDITNKLYQMSEKISNEKGSQIDIRLPVIINSFTKRLEVTPPTSSLHVAASAMSRSRVLVPRSAESRNRTNSNTAVAVAATPSAAISPLATASISRSLEHHAAETGSARREKTSSATTSDGTSTSHSSSEIFIEMPKDALPETGGTAACPSEEEDDSTSASYAAMSLSDTGSLTKKSNRATSQDRTTAAASESTAVNIPLIPKSGKNS